MGGVYFVFAQTRGNADERLIKRAVLNRKNGLFFKTEFGAYVGDILLSVIETCQLNKINPYHYLIAIQKYKDKVNENPSLLRFGVQSTERKTG